MLALTQFVVIVVAVVFVVVISIIVVAVGFWVHIVLLSLRLPLSLICCPASVPSPLSSSIGIHWYFSPFPLYIPLHDFSIYSYFFAIFRFPSYLLTWTLPFHLFPSCLHLLTFLSWFPSLYFPHTLLLLAFSLCVPSLLSFLLPSIPLWPSFLHVLPGRPSHIIIIITPPVCWVVKSFVSDILLAGPGSLVEKSVVGEMEGHRFLKTAGKQTRSNLSACDQGDLFCSVVWRHL